MWSHDHVAAVVVPPKPQHRVHKPLLEEAKLELELVPGQDVALTISVCYRGVGQFLCDAIRKAFPSRRKSTAVVVLGQGPQSARFQRWDAREPPTPANPQVATCHG